MLNYLAAYRPSPSDQPKRIIAIDVLKILGALLVILIHACSSALPSGLSNPFGNFLWLSALPLFFLCSGFVAPSGIDTWRRLLSRVLKTTLVLLVPCLSFGIIKLLLGYFDRNPITMVISFVQNPETNLWFLWVLWVINIVFFLGLFAFARIRRDWLRLGLVLLSLLLFVGALAFLVLKVDIGKLLSLKYVVFYTPFFGLGFLFRRFTNSLISTTKNVEIASWVIWALCAVCLLFFIFRFKSIQDLSDIALKDVAIRYVGSLAACVFLLGIVGAFVGKERSVGIARLGSYSLEIYYIHILFWEPLKAVRFSNNDLLSLLLVTLTLIASTTGIILLIKYIPFLERCLFGRGVGFFDKRVISAISRQRQQR